MERVDVKVTLVSRAGAVVAYEDNVSLNDDEVSIAAGNLAYGLVEDVWGLLVKEDEK